MWHSYPNGARRPYYTKGIGLACSVLMRYLVLEKVHELRMDAEDKEESSKLYCNSAICRRWVQDIVRGVDEDDAVQHMSAMLANIGDHISYCEGVRCPDGMDNPQTHELVKMAGDTVDISKWDEDVRYVRCALDFIRSETLRIK